MPDLWLEFGQGDCLPVSLCSDVAAHNTSVLCAALPLRSVARHCGWSGEGLFFNVEGLDVRAENQRTLGIQPGTLCLEHYPAGVRVPGPWTALLLVYGTHFWFKNPFTPSWPLCVVGQVEANTAGLASLGERLHRMGREDVFVRPGDGSR